MRIYNESSSGNCFRLHVARTLRGTRPWLAPTCCRQVVPWWRRLSRAPRASAFCAFWGAPRIEFSRFGPFWRDSGLISGCASMANAVLKLLTISRASWLWSPTLDVTSDCQRAGEVRLVDLPAALIALLSYWPLRLLFSITTVLFAAGSNHLKLLKPLVSFRKHRRSTSPRSLASTNTRIFSWISASSCLRPWAAVVSTSFKALFGSASRHLDLQDFPRPHAFRSLSDILDLAIGIALVACGALNLLMHFGGLAGACRLPFARTGQLSAESEAGL